MACESGTTDFTSTTRTVARRRVQGQHVDRTALASKSRNETSTAVSHPARPSRATTNVDQPGVGGIDEPVETLPMPSKQRTSSVAPSARAIARERARPAPSSRSPRLDLRRSAAASIACGVRHRSCCRHRRRMRSARIACPSLIGDPSREG